MLLTQLDKAESADTSCFQVEFCPLFCTVCQQCQAAGGLAGDDRQKSKGQSDARSINEDSQMRAKKNAGKERVFLEVPARVTHSSS